MEGRMRPVINLKALNFWHFKMEGIHTLREIVAESEWLTKLDLKDAYFTVPIFQEHQEYLRFVGLSARHYTVCPAHTRGDQSSDRCGIPTYDNTAYVFDATAFINDPGRYINHARRNNNLIKMPPVPIGKPTKDNLKIRFVARKDIAHGGELFIDYGLKKDPDFPCIATNAKDIRTSLEKLDTTSVQYVNYDYIWVLFTHIDQIPAKKGASHLIEPSKPTTVYQWCSLWLEVHMHVIFKLNNIMPLS